MWYHIEMENKKIQYVIFDFDGTLADSGEIAFRAMNAMAEKQGFRKIDWSEIEDIRKMNVRERSKYMGVPLLKIPTMAQEFYKYYKEHMQEMQLNEGIDQLLKDLHSKGYKTAVISSNSEDNIREFLLKRNIPMEDVLCSSHLFSKDRIINKFLRHKGLGSEQALYVGDETRDIDACKKADVKVAWVNWGLDVEENVISHEPDFLVKDAKEIMNILDELED